MPGHKRKPTARKGTAPPHPRREAPNKKLTDQAYELAATLLAARVVKSEIKRRLREKFKISNRSVETAITGGRKLLVLASGKNEEEHKNDAYSFYNSIVSDIRAGVRNRLLAQERMDKLLSLEGPIKVDLGGGLALRGELAHTILNDDRAADLLDQLDDALAAKRSGGKK